MRKLILFEHVSLDGMAAGTGGAMSWIHVDEEIFDYVGEKAHQAGAGLYGRVTYEMMDGYWPTAGSAADASRHDKEHSAWYNRVEKIVASRSMQGQQRDKVTFIGNDLPAELRALKAGEGKDIVLFGSISTVHTLMQHDLIDEYWLFINPVLLGEGVPLFNQAAGSRKLSLVSSRAFSSGVVCLHYTLRKD